MGRNLACEKQKHRKSRSCQEKTLDSSSFFVYSSEGDV